MENNDLPTKNDEGNSEPGLERTLSSETENPYPNNTKPQPHWYGKHPLEWAVGLLLLLTFVATATAAVFTERQWIEERRQAQTAVDALALTRQEFEVSQRAFVSIDIGTPIAEKDNSGNVVAFFLEASFTNVGNTATKGMRTEIYCPTSAKNMSEPWSLRLKENGPQRGNVSFVLGPHETSTSACSVPVNDLIKVQNGQLYGFLMARATYFDRLNDGVPLVTEMASKYFAYLTFSPAIDTNSDATGGASQTVTDFQMQSLPVGNHNCADDDCPADNQ